MSKIENDEEQIIADGLTKVADGIRSNNWQLVCDGYNSISGEDLKPPVEIKKQSKLEKIRSKIKKQATPVTEDTTDETPETPMENETISDGEDTITISKGVIKRKDFGKAGENGKQFGQKNMQVISVAYDAKEAKRNKLLANKTTKKQRKSQKHITETLKQPEGDIHFNNNPSKSRTSPDS